MGNAARESFAPASGGAHLFCREVGDGAPLVVLHGGPDFDHTYLLPDMDRLADGYRLVYYDQRGRGRSRGPLDLEAVNVDLYVEDLECARRHVGLGSMAVLGHSWGGLLAMHHALAYPDHVSHLVLLNTAPASTADMALGGEERVRRRARYGGRMEEIAASPEFAAGNPQAVSEYWSLDFATTFKRPEDARRLKIASSREDTLRGRAIEDRLMARLYADEAFTLLPRLETLRGVRVLVIHGDLDFFPPQCSERISRAIPGAKLVVLPDSGHFSYIDAPGPFRDALAAFYPAAGSRV